MGEEETTTTKLITEPTGKPEGEKRQDWKGGARQQWKIGRPRKYKTPEEFIERAQEYFDSCVDDKGELNQPITITGMCNFLGTTRRILMEYETGSLESLKDGSGDDEGFRNAIKCVKSICEHYAETHGFMARNPAFAIFALKNYGWKDTQTIETTTTEIHTIDPETRQLVGEYIRQLAEAQKRPIIDITPRELPEPVKVQSGARGQISAESVIEMDPKEGK